MDIVSIINTILLGLIGLVLGAVLIPFLAYSFPIKGLGKICFSLGAMCHHSGTCLMYDNSGYSLCHMRKKEDNKTWEVYYQGTWMTLSGSVINMLGNRPFGISFIKDKNTFLSELETRRFTEKVNDEWYYTGDDVGEITGVIHKDAVDMIKRKTAFVISLRLLVSRLSESGGIKLGERAITAELKKAALAALTNNSTNTILLLVSLGAVVAGAFFGYMIWFYPPGGAELAAALP